ncbi:pyridoxal phosphate-dependent aminotransferase [Nonomuraea sp. NPDC004354]
MSPNLRLNEEVAARVATGEPVLNLGFGEARLPAFAPLVRLLRDSAHRNRYGPVAGESDVRRAGADYFARRGLATDAGQIVVGPGSKPLLFALNLVMPGDVVLPRPCWNSYRPQAEFTGKRTVHVAIPDECGGVPDPAQARKAIRRARAEGHDPRILILTTPDNPTGTVVPPELIREICAVAREENLLIVSDEVYRDTLHDSAMTFLSPAEVEPERTVVVTGLSKSLALGGWRIGMLRVPDGAFGEWLRDGLVAVASDVWSSLAGPMQAVAEYAFSEPLEVQDRRLAAARLHGHVARAVHRAVVSAGATCRPPTAGFYLYPDLERLRSALARQGVADSPRLQRRLLDRYGIAVLGGHQLDDDRRALRFKVATSMLYGDTPEQQEESLAADDPLKLPHVEQAVSRIKHSFADLCRSRP